MVLELLDNITPNKYLHSAIILLIFYALSQLVVFISQRVILQLTKKTKTNLDDLIVSKTNKPISLILILLGLRLAIIPHKVKPYILDVFEHIVASLIVVMVAYIFIVVFDILIINWGRKFAAKTESKVDDEVVLLFQRFSRITLSLIGLIFILNVWGIEVAPLLASLGIAGIAVAFALQSTLGNIFGGISLILDKTIKVGDVVFLDQETKGTVIDIGLRSTKIKSRAGDLVILPNGKLADSKIYNYHKPLPTTRVGVDFGVKYGSDAGEGKKIALKELNSLKGALKEPAPQVIFTEMGDYALRFKAFFWVESIEVKLEAKEAATTAIYNALNRNKIGIPFPTRTVYLNK